MESLERARREVDAYLDDASTNELESVRLIVELAKVEQMAGVREAIENCCNRIDGGQGQIERMTEAFGKTVEAFAEYIAGQGK